MDATTLHALAVFPDLLQAHYLAIPPQFRQWTPPTWDGVPSVPFTALEQICHVRDIEIDGYHRRFARTLNDHCPHLRNVDAEALRLLRDYAHADAQEILVSFRQARGTTLELLVDLTEEQLQRPAVFEDRPTTMLGLTYSLSSHDRRHLAGLKWLRAQTEELKRFTWHK